jgi:hypothetical protein
MRQEKCRPGVGTGTGGSENGWSAKVEGKPEVEGLASGCPAVTE